jgi:hypothetical protein
MPDKYEHKVNILSSILGGTSCSKSIECVMFANRKSGPPLEMRRVDDQLVTLALRSADHLKVQPAYCLLIEAFSYCPISAL